MMSPAVAEMPDGTRARPAFEIMANRYLEPRYSADVVEDKTGAIAYSSDTGPTERFWDVVNKTRNLKAVITERVLVPWSACQGSSSWPSS